mmetsp:Transcript_14176/g.29814  ORF Transcript_14176/g.29814 Transcript_14176/m.29814 type:complete len:129 (+) Transcript_14176:528-914(+)
MLSPLFVSLRFLLQLFEQVVTLSQHRSHFFLQLNGLSQTTQILVGRFSFFTPRGILLLRALFKNAIRVPAGAIDGGPNPFKETRRKLQIEALTEPLEINGKKRTSCLIVAIRVVSENSGVAISDQDNK